MGLKHAKESLAEDTSDASLVQASDWNADHKLDSSFIEGDILIAGAGGSITRIGPGDDGTVLGRVDGAYAWVDAPEGGGGGGGGGGSTYVMSPGVYENLIDVPPGVTGRFADEFASGTIGTDWFVRTPGSTSAVISEGALRLKGPSATERFVGVSRLVGTGKHFVAKVGLNSPVRNYSGIWFGVKPSDTATGSAFGVGLLFFDGVIRLWAEGLDTTYDVATETDLTRWADPDIYIQVSFAEDNTVTFSVSHNGGDFVPVASATPASLGWTPARIAIWSQTLNSEMSSYCEWVREGDGTIASIHGTPNALPTESEIGYRWYRVYITANNGDAYTAISELELRQDAGGADLTDPSTTVFAGPTYVSTPPSYAVDDAFTNPWITDNGALPNYLVVDFGVRKVVRELAIAPQSNGEGNHNLRGVRNFALQGSNYTGSDPQYITDWVTLGTYTGVDGWVESTFKTFAVADSAYPRDMAVMGTARYQFRADRPPAVHNGWDDEFNGNALGAHWTLVNPTSGGATATATVDNGSVWLSDNVPVAGQVRLLTRALPTGDFTIEAKLVNHGACRYNNVGLGIYLPSTETWRGVRGVMREAGSNRQTMGWLSFTDCEGMGSAIEGSNDGYLGETVYVQLRRVGNVYTWRWSGTREQWSVVKASWTEASPDWQLALSYSCSLSDSSDYPSKLECQWVRRVA